VKQSRGSAVTIADYLWAGQPRGPSSSLGTVKNFHFSVSSRLALEPNQSHIVRVPGLFLGVKRPGPEAHSPSVEFKKT
jgi:hypothetical protein